VIFIRQYVSEGCNVSGKYCVKEVERAIVGALDRTINTNYREVARRRPMPVSKPQHVRNVMFSLLALVAALSLAACGSGGTSGGGPVPGGTSTVVVQLTSTANDQLIEYSTGVASISLVDKTGTTVSIFNNSNVYSGDVEWMHLNGAAEPFLAAASVPQGTYTSAVVTTAGCSFTLVTWGNATSSAGLTTATYAEGSCGEGTGETTVNLPAPIVVSGKVTVLNLNLQVGSSWAITQPATADNPIASYTIDPTFTLTKVPLAAAPANLTNGLLPGVSAQVTAVSANPASATITLANSATFTVTPSPTATYQGITGFSALTANEIVNMDLAIQPDGSFAATRVEVDDPASVYANIGWYVTAYSPLGTYGLQTTQPEGCPNFVQFPECQGLLLWDASTTFNVSGQITNVSNLPFSPDFNNSSATPAQNLSGSVYGTGGNQNLPDAQVLTLEPQTLNGTVQSMTTQNGFAVYTVSLAAYDLFPVTQQNVGAYLVPVTNPTMVTVYADTNTQFLNTGMVEQGQVLRFRGVVFNDNGALQMDCNEVLDGVTE
jgi:hypothetical protein